MTTYQVFSQKINADLQLKYSDNGRIIGVEMLVDNVTIDEQLRINIFANAPSTVGSLLELAKRYKWSLTEIKPDVSFDTFWKRYSNTSGSKIKAAKCWEKLNDKEKNDAINYINKYKQSLGTTTQAYATTYLNGQYWVK